MWATGSCAEIPETSHQNDNEYTPPEKKSKESSENDSLNEALECCIRHDLGIEEASLIYGIPKRTLRARLKDSNFSVIDEKYRVFVLSSYPAEAENDLVEYLQNCITSQITLTTVEVRRLGYELVCEKYNMNTLPREKNCILGQRWYQKFIEKYPHLDIRHQMLRVNQDRSVDFYNTLQVLANKYGIDASQIFSVEGVELKFRASCVDDLKIFHKRRTIYTDGKAICCASPAGNFVPPVFLKLHNNCNLEMSDPNLNIQEESDFPNTWNKSHVSTVCDKLKEMCNVNIKNLPPSEDLANIEKQIKMHLNKNLQPMSEENEEELREKLYEQFKELRNKLIAKYESALNEVTPEIFHSWFLDFLDFVKPNTQKKVLLLLSDQSFVKSFKILELGKKNGVIFLVLPPHTTHKIYPLDGFAMSLNRNLSTCARRWLGKNPDFKVQQVPLHLLFMEAYRETVNPIIAKNGFLFSGIWPINRNIFESSELGGQSVLLRNNSHSTVSASYILNTGTSNSQNNLSPGIIKEGDIGKLCRVCMKEKMYMKPLFESLPSMAPNYHGKKISEITEAPISQADGLPKSLCQYCLVQLMDTIKIKGMAVESHRKQLKIREALDRIYFEGKDSEKQALQSLLQADMPSKIINSILSKNMDLNSMCRICMGEKPLMTSIFFRPQDGSVFCADTCNKIMEVSQCQVHIHDGLSSSICPFCRASINKASEFIRKLLSSDKILREIVSQFRANN